MLIDDVSVSASISSHAPRGGERYGTSIVDGEGVAFLSPLPAGARPSHRSMGPTGMPFQSTLPAGGATYLPIHGFDRTGISIHAPHGGEATSSDSDGSASSFNFNPRSPRGKRPVLYKPCRVALFQSTLTLWE